MGVLPCDRVGCDNIMCDRYSHEYGYICNECFNELVSARVGYEIERFMNSRKTAYKEDENKPDYDSIFPVRE